jgi:hypothetical protein
MHVLPPQACVTPHYVLGTYSGDMTDEETMRTAQEKYDKDSIESNNHRSG